jgi:hypothetical protein
VYSGDSAPNELSRIEDAARVERGCRERKRRSRAALPVIEHWDAKLPGLIGEIAGDAGAGEDDDACRHDVEHAVVALEGRGLAVTGPVGLEGNLRDIAAVGLAGQPLPRHQTSSSFGYNFKEVAAISSLNQNQEPVSARD